MLNYYLIKKNNSKTLFNSFLHLSEAFYDEYNYYITDNCRIRTEKYKNIWNIYYRGDMGKPINNHYDLLARRLDPLADRLHYMGRPKPGDKYYWVYLHRIQTIRAWQREKELPWTVIYPEKLYSA